MGWFCFKIFFLQKRDKLPTKQTKFRDTVSHEIFAGSNFCDFSSHLQKKINANISPAKIYSRVNILWLKFATQKYSTTISVVSVQLQLDHLFHPETKTVYIMTRFYISVYAYHIVLFENMYFFYTLIAHT